MRGLYKYWWLVTSLEYGIAKKETLMLYVSKFIKFKAFLDLLWKYNLLVHYKLKKFRPPRVYQFDIHALLFWGYSRFIPLDKTVLYG